MPFLSQCIMSSRLMAKTPTRVCELMWTEQKKRNPWIIECRKCALVVVLHSLHEPVWKIKTQRKMHDWPLPLSLPKVCQQTGDKSHISWSKMGPSCSRLLVKSYAYEWPGRTHGRGTEDRNGFYIARGDKKWKGYPWHKMYVIFCFLMWSVPHWRW